MLLNTAKGFLFTLRTLLQLCSLQRENARLRAELEHEGAARATLQLQVDSKDTLLSSFRSQVESKQGSIVLSPQVLQNGTAKPDASPSSTGSPDKSPRVGLGQLLFFRGWRVMTDRPDSENIVATVTGECTSLLCRLKPVESKITYKRQFSQFWMR